MEDVGDAVALEHVGEAFRPAVLISQDFWAVHGFNPPLAPRREPRRCILGGRELGVLGPRRKNATEAVYKFGAGLV